MAMTISGTSGITFPSTAVQSDAGLGYTQTWQNLTASRALNTTYTNSTGRPILVGVYTYTGGPNYVELVINGNVVSVSSGGTVTYEGGVYGVVPVGATYRATSNSGLQTWCELR